MKFDDWIKGFEDRYTKDQLWHMRWAWDVSAKDQQNIVSRRVDKTLDRTKRCHRRLLDAYNAEKKRRIDVEKEIKKPSLEGLEEATKILDGKYDKE